MGKNVNSYGYCQQEALHRKFVVRPVKAGVKYGDFTALRMAQLSCELHFLLLKRSASIVGCKRASQKPSVLKNTLRVF